jgi:hypothetical protein
LGTVAIRGKTFDIYGEQTTDTPGEPVSATTYFIGQLNTSSWDAADSTTRGQALVTAGRIFDKQLWVGTVTDVVTPQPLAWPRTGVPTCDGIVADPDEIPERVIFGSYELANAILADAEVQTETNTGSNTKRNLNRQKVGDLEVETETEYFSATNSGATAATRFPTEVQEYVRCYIGGTAQGATVAGGAASVFLDWDFGLSGNGTL